MTTNDSPPELSPIAVPECVYKTLGQSGDTGPGCGHLEYATVVVYGPGHRLAWCADCPAQFVSDSGDDDDWRTT